MKNLICFLILGLCVSLSVKAGDVLDCRELLVQEIEDFLQESDGELVALLYHQAALKVAMEASGESRNTAEALAQKLKNRLDQMPESETMALEALYREFGQTQDLQRLEESFSSANYWQSPLRFTNEDASAFILAHQVFQEDSSLNKTDAAVVWLVDVMTSELQPGSLNYNLLNFTQRVSKLTGAISGERRLSRDEFAEEGLIFQSQLKDEFQDIYDSFLEEYALECGDWMGYQRSCVGELFIQSDILPETFLNLRDEAEKASQVRLEDGLRVRYSDVISFELGEINLSSGKRLAREVPYQQDRRDLSDLRRRWERAQGLLKDDKQVERIHYFYEKYEPETQLYGVIDREAKKVTFYRPGSDAPVARFELIYPPSGSDRIQDGSAGAHSFAYTSGLGQVFLSDHSGDNIAYRVSDLERAQEYLEHSDVIYILPIEEGNYFKVKDERLVFATKNRILHPEDYNFTPPRREYRALEITITDDSYKTTEALKFVKALEDHKEKLMEIYNLSNEDYDKMAAMAFGILGNESSFGRSFRYKVKEALPLLVSLAKGNLFDTSDNSRGLTQIKTVPQKIREHYSIKKEELGDPEKSAIATMGFLAQSLPELRAKQHHHPDITPENRLDYLHYIYMGKSYEITQATATPELNIYFRQIHEYAAGLSLSSP